jgi:hypothetical protein
MIDEVLRHSRNFYQSAFRAASRKRKLRIISSLVSRLIPT